MFTIKFYKNNKEGVNCETVSAPNYSKFTRNDGSIEVVVYPKLTNENGVCRNVRKDSDTVFSSFFVENQSGKTVDGFGHSL